MRPSHSQLLRRAQLPAMLITNPVNIAYIAGFSDEGAILHVSPKGLTLFVSPLELDMAQDALRSGIALRSTLEFENIMKRARRIGFEAEHVTIGRLKRWKKLFSNTSFVSTENIVEEFRRSKSDEEIRALKQAEAITQKILRRIPSILTPGISELEVAEHIEDWAKELGADGLSFESIVGFGIHTSRPHHRPTSKKLKKRDIIQIDIGTCFKGYCADLSKVFFVGKPTSEQQHVYDVVHEAKEAAKQSIHVGAHAKDIDTIARTILKKHHLEQYFIHSLGHGVGLEVHEGAHLSARSTQKLLKSEVITIEPGVYLPGKFGVRLEEMVYVK